MQRMGDHGRIQNFLTGSSLATLFSMVNLVVFGGVLAYYDIRILGIFLLGNTLYILWIVLFLRRRRDLDFKYFANSRTSKAFNSSIVFPLYVNIFFVDSIIDIIFFSYLFLKVLSIKLLLQEVHFSLQSYS